MFFWTAVTLIPRIINSYASVMLGLFLTSDMILLLLGVILESLLLSTLSLESTIAKGVMRKSHIYLITLSKMLEYNQVKKLTINMVIVYPNNGAVFFYSDRKGIYGQLR